MTDKKTPKAPRRFARQPDASQADAPAPAAPTSKPSKQDLVITLLRRPEGATLAEMMEPTGWLPHSTRAVLTGLRKKGHTIEKTRRNEVTCYRIVEAA